MPVHGVRPLEQLGEPLEAQMERDRQADGRPQGVAPADPVPEAEHVGGIDAEALDRRLVGRDGDEVAGHGPLVLELVEQPGAGAGGVGHRLLGREGLGGDDEEGALRARAGPG